MATLRTIYVGQACQTHGSPSFLMWPAKAYEEFFYQMLNTIGKEKVRKSRNQLLIIEKNNMQFIKIE